MTMPEQAVAEPESPWEDAYGARFLTLEDLGARKLTLRIRAGEWVRVWCRAGASEHGRLALHLNTGDGKPCRKPVVVNKTSAAALKAAWGEVAADGQTWNGKAVTLRAERVNGKPALLIEPAKEK
jgi:hypothetical protein